MRPIGDLFFSFTDMKWLSTILIKNVSQTARKPIRYMVNHFACVCGNWIIQWVSVEAA
jgi:hypothetical protein